MGGMILDRGVYDIEVSSGDGMSISHVTYAIDGVDYVKFGVSEGSAPVMERVTVKWKCSAVDVHGMWRPGAERSRQLPADWSGGVKCDISKLAPVACFFSPLGMNRLTLALSDTLNRVTVSAGINEEGGVLCCSFTLFDDPVPFIQNYEAVVRLDCREIPYFDALHEVSVWWANQEEPRITIPTAAREPVYSTWYSMHQGVSASLIERQAGLAKSLGCEVIIVDDGWQTDDMSRGYAYCGDWEVAKVKIPNMASHVANVHSLGMKYVLWYSVPFVGVHSKAWSKFQDKLLGRIERLGAGVVDPRFREVREYLVQMYEQAITQWDIDGLKLDFIDTFAQFPDAEQVTGAGRDIDTVPRAVHALLSEIVTRLRKHKPDLLIEFRQNYVGPMMRMYANMFRAADCPYDALENRVRTVNIRLISGDTPTHSDMLMWNPAETAETAALQFINVLFSVPQISVELDAIPASHLEMLTFWTHFWREHRDVLLGGHLRPTHPEVLFPLITASTPEKSLTVTYSNLIIVWESGTLPGTVVLVNGTQRDEIVVDVRGVSLDGEITIRDCRGTFIDQTVQSLPQGLHRIMIPPSGVLILKQMRENCGHSQARAVL